MLEMIAVQSRSIKRIGYTGETLWVEFKESGIYAYQGVPESVYKALLHANSKGTYFDVHIRGRYTYNKVN